MPNADNAANATTAAADDEIDSDEASSANRTMTITQLVMFTYLGAAGGPYASPALPLPEM